MVDDLLVSMVAGELLWVIAAGILQAWARPLLGQASADPGSPIAAMFRLIKTSTVFPAGTVLAVTQLSCLDEGDCLPCLK